jgi:hypothetical protein
LPRRHTHWQKRCRILKIVTTYCKRSIQSH